MCGCYFFLFHFIHTLSYLYCCQKKKNSQRNNVNMSSFPRGRIFHCMLLLETTRLVAMFDIIRQGVLNCYIMCINIIVYVLFCLILCVRCSFCNIYFDFGIAPTMWYFIFHFIQVFLSLIFDKVC